MSTLLDSFVDVNGTEKFENGTWEVLSGNDTLREDGGDEPDVEENSEVGELNAADDDAPSESTQPQSEEDEAASEERQVGLYYRIVQLHFASEIGVFYVLLDRCHFNVEMDPSNII